MMDVQELYLSEEGLANLKAEMEDLKEQRVDITQKIKEAREFGDLSENAEYQEAKIRQSFVEGRIEEIEAMLKSAKIITGNDHAKGIVGLGTTVTVEFNGKQVEYHVTGSSEADPALRKISNESPLGRALIGHGAGDKVVLSTPDGDREYKIVKVS